MAETGEGNSLIALTTSAPENGTLASSGSDWDVNEGTPFIIIVTVCAFFGCLCCFVFFRSCRQKPKANEDLPSPDMRAEASSRPDNNSGEWEAIPAHLLVGSLTPDYNLHANSLPNNSHLVEKDGDEQQQTSGLDTSPDYVPLAQQNQNPSDQPLYGQRDTGMVMVDLNHPDNHDADYEDPPTAKQAAKQYLRTPQELDYQVLANSETKTNFKIYEQTATGITIVEHSHPEAKDYNNLPPVSKKAGAHTYEKPILLSEQNKRQTTVSQHDYEEIDDDELPRVTPTAPTLPPNAKLSQPVQHVIGFDYTDMPPPKEPEKCPVAYDYALMEQPIRSPPSASPTRPPPPPPTAPQHNAPDTNNPHAYNPFFSPSKPNDDCQPSLPPPSCPKGGLENLPVAQPIEEPSSESLVEVQVRQQQELLDRYAGSEENTNQQPAPPGVDAGYWAGLDEESRAMVLHSLGDIAVE
eukprot:m.20387 g.20387  ORF g.20387 m.20387 type:complete len:465 (+) comp12469_c0_seq1:175-1569(+)